MNKPSIRKRATDSILVCCPQKVLTHKKRDGKKSKGRVCYWELSRRPKKKIKKIYFAVKGIVQGHFKVHRIEDADEAVALFFDSESWIEQSKPKPKIIPSQGWRYYAEGKE